MSVKYFPNFMMTSEDYIEVNRQLWNTKAEAHFETPYYNVKEFIENPQFLSLSHMEIEPLGNIEGKRILHLQCHFGLDTMSLARLGAKEVVGVDLSDVAIKKAEELTKKLQLDDRVKFICCDLFKLDQHLSTEQSFDIVFTSFGTTKWFPDLKKWSTLIQQYTKPGGLFAIVDFHPILWTFDDQFVKLASHSYFNREQSK